MPTTNVAKTLRTYDVFTFNVVSTIAVARRMPILGMDEANI